MPHPQHPPSLSGTKRPAASAAVVASAASSDPYNGGDDGDADEDESLLTEEEKRKRRLERNRIAARECRRRKKEATQQLEHEISMLEAENLKLRVQLKVGEEGDEFKRKEQEQLHEEMEQLLKSGASDGEIQACVQKYKDTHLDYGKNARSAIEYHLRQVERLLKPTPATAVPMMAILAGKQQEFPNPAFARQASDAAASSEAGESSSSGSGKPAAGVEPVRDSTQWKAAAIAARSKFDPSTPIPDPLEGVDPENPVVDPKDLLNFLFNYLGIGPDQAEYLCETEQTMHGLDGYLTDAHITVTKLREGLTRTGEDLDGEMQVLKETLTPSQAAKFLLWVAKNKGAIYMLEQLWQLVFPTSPTKEESKEQGQEDGPSDPKVQKT